MNVWMARGLAAIVIGVVLQVVDNESAKDIGYVLLLIGAALLVVGLLSLTRRR